MESIQQKYIHRHDPFNADWEAYSSEEFDPFESGHRLVIVRPPRFIFDYINIFDTLFNLYNSESVRDIIQRKYISYIEQKNKNDREE